MAAMHNFQLSHKVRKPCRRCGTFVPALKVGQMIHSPLCRRCEAHDVAIWRKAMIQRTRTEKR